MDDRAPLPLEESAVRAVRRPVSPHLQVYRLPVTALLSITHRMTGVALSLGFPVLVLCLMAGAAGPQSYVKVQGFLAGVPGSLFLWGWLYALFFHLCHGVRHLIWDTGTALSRDHQDLAASLELAVSLSFVLLTWLAASYL